MRPARRSRRPLHFALALLMLSGNGGSTSIATLKSLGWKEKSFVGHTQYTLEISDDAETVVGKTNGQASALYQDKSVNLQDTPHLNWRWRVSGVYDNPDEKTKSGDDFPARLYVVYKRGFMGWNSAIINYVWSSQNAVGDTWTNAYTDKSRIMVLQTGSAEIGQWFTEKRNIVNDFKSLHNLDVTTLSGYAIMVDGDNTGSSATAWFKDISFTQY